MNSQLPDRFMIDTPALLVECAMVPWDMAAFGFPVAQVEGLEIRNNLAASADFNQLLAWGLSMAVLGAVLSYLLF